MPSPSPIWTGEVTKSGLLKFDHPQHYERFKQTLAGGRFVMRLERRKVRRTLDQNAGWWGVILPAIAEHCGYDAHEHDALHYALLEKCFGSQNKGGLAVPNQPSSSNLNIEQFTHLIDWAYRFAATELGCVIPPMEGE